MSPKNKNSLLPPKFRQANSDGIINIPEIIAMGVKYIVMQVDKYQQVELLDKIEGEIYLKDNINDKVKSIPYYVTPDKLDDDFYFLFFYVSEINVFGLCEAKYTVKDFDDNYLYSLTSNITILGGNDMGNSDYELVFKDAKKSILNLHLISKYHGVRVRAKFKNLAVSDTIVITASIFDENGGELNSLKSESIVLIQEQINSGYVDCILKTDKVNISEVKYIVANFSVLNKNIASGCSKISIFNDFDNVNVKVQITKNIGARPSSDQDIKPFLTAVIYTDLNNSSSGKLINAQLTNAHFSDDSNNTLLSDIDENGVGYLNIYSDDITKNSMLILNYTDPVIAYKIPLDFSNWLTPPDGKLIYTYSSYGVADGVCQCFLLIKILSNKITDIIVKFDDSNISINESTNVLQISNPDSNKMLIYALTSNKAVRSQFTINVGGISMQQINNTIVFVDPLTF
ncbi:hypothetical protein [Xenorhabdus sp. Sc-CR9]|uniref:hypothetical protein n=1 Tax=Xenorhabdus sp. Sc-CR9 TaxID=2584468 RepID=UPI001F2B9394|nr:hypothetical protein [Xenorhabdus sp. Sc-CR9]